MSSLGSTIALCAVVMGCQRIQIFRKEGSSPQSLLRRSCSGTFSIFPRSVSSFTVSVRLFRLALEPLYPL
jgi:hypothetical protein